MLRESQEILNNAEEDVKDALLGLPGLLSECDKTEAQADELAAELAAREVAHSQESYSQPSAMSALVLPDSGYDVQSTLISTRAMRRIESREQHKRISRRTMIGRQS